MSSHAVLSPSGAARWTRCTGSVALSKDIPNTTSKYAEEGTQAHATAAECLTGSTDCGDADVMTYVNAIRRAAEGKLLWIEQSVPISQITTEEGAEGTADAIIFDVASGVLEVHDLKFGQGHLVDAEGNEQLMMYALGAWAMVDIIAEVKSFKLVIHQPRRDHMSETEVTVKSLLEFGSRVKTAGLTALSALEGMSEVVLNPSEKACQWCRAKTICPALRAQIHEAVIEDFAIDAANDAAQVPSPDFLTMVDDWVSAMRKAIYERLQNGVPTPGWKLVKGKKGNRKWISEKLTGELLKHLGFKKGQTHETKLLSLTQIEKLVPADKWPLFLENITQADGPPSAVPDTDQRPEIVSAAIEEFDTFK